LLALLKTTRHARHIQSILLSNRISDVHGVHDLVWLCRETLEDFVYRGFTPLKDILNSIRCGEITLRRLDISVKINSKRALTIIGQHRSLEALTLGSVRPASTDDDVPADADPFDLPNLVELEVWTTCHWQLLGRSKLPVLKALVIARTEIYEPASFEELGEFVSSRHLDIVRFLQFGDGGYMDKEDSVIRLVRQCWADVLCFNRVLWQLSEAEPDDIPHCVRELWFDVPFLLEQRPDWVDLIVILEKIGGMRLASPSTNPMKVAANGVDTLRKTRWGVAHVCDELEDVNVSVHDFLRHAD
jgi:hypothetical protein